MIFKPWDCAQPDEWLPRSLRLCWGSGDSSDSGGGGNTGGGDWGSAGSYDASGFDAGGIGAWGGTAYDASYMGQPAGGGGDWGSFGDTNYASFNAPNPTFEDVGGPNAGVTTGGGDWGSAGAFSAAGTGGGPGGAMFGAAQGAASGLWGGGDPGGGGLFGDYGGGGGGGGYYGGGGQQGGGGSFGGFGTTGTLGGSNAVAAAPTGPTGSAFADSYGGGSLSGSAGPAAASGHSMGGQLAAAAASDAGPSESEAAPSEGDTSTAPSESQFGEPAQTEAAPSQDEAAPTQDEAAPEVSSTIAGGRETNFDYGPQAAPAETETSQSNFGPQSVIAGGRETNFDYGPSQSYQQASQQLSDLTQSALAPQQDSFDSRFGFDTSAPTPAVDAYISGGRETNFDYGPSQAYQQAAQQLSELTQSGLDPTNWGAVFEGTTPPAEVTAPAIETSIPGDRGETNFDYGPFGGFDSQAYQDASQALSNLTQSALAPADVNWGSVFEALSDPAYQNDRSGPIGPIAPDPEEPFSDLITAPINPIMYPFAQSLDYLMGLNPTNITNPATAWSNFAQNALLGGSNIQPLNADAFAAFEAGQQGRAGANPDTTPWGSVFEGANPDPTDYASVFEGAAPAVEGLNPGAEQYGIEARTPAIEAFIPGGRETNFEYEQGINPGAEQYWSPPPQEQSTPIDIEVVRSDDPSVPADPRAQPTTLPPAVEPTETRPAEEPQEAPPQEAQPAPPQEAQPAPPQEAQPAPPQQVEQTQPQEAQPAPPSLIEQAQTPPAEVQPTAPPSLVEQAQSMPGEMLSFPGTLTPQVQPTEAPQQAQPSVPMPQSRPADTPVPVGPFVALPGKQVTGLEANIPANPTTGMPAMKGIDTTNNGKNGGPLGKVEAIITHFSGGGGNAVGGLVSQMMKGGAGYNYIVDKDGNAYQLRPDGVTAGHVGDKGKPSGKGNFAGYFNNNSIGVGALAENEAALTPPQIATMKAIVTALGKANNLPPSQVFGHAAVDSNRGEGEGSTVAGWAKGLAGWPSSQAQTRVVDVPRPPADIPAPGRITYYAPGGRGKEGGYETSRPNPTTGKYTPSTLDDVRLGKSDFVTLAADPRRYGESVNLGTINYRSPIDGKTYTLPNVKGIVHDTGSAFKGKLDKLDVAIGDFRGWSTGKAQAFVANNGRRLTADAAPSPAAQPQPPADIPAALPPPTMPLAPEPARPPADIPVTLTPPRAGRTDPALQARTASQIAADLAAKGPRPTSMSTGQTALNGLARALAQAGIPAAIAQQTVTETARAGTRAAGYDPDGIASGYITSMTGTAMQGYQPARPGEVQGPPSPSATPGKQGAAPFGQRYASMSQLLGEPAPEEDLGREGDVSAREAIRPWDIMPLEQLSPMIAPPAPPPTWGRPPAPPPPPMYTPGGPGMFNPFRGNEAALPGGLLHLAAGGRDVGAPPAIEPGQLPGRAEGEPTLPGAPLGGNLPTAFDYPVDPRSGELSGKVFDPANAGRGQVFDPDVFQQQQIEQEQNQQNLDPRGWQQASNFNLLSDIRALAKGGHVDKDEPVVVGEEGPETFVPDQPGTVVPHMPQPGKGKNVDRWPKMPAVLYPGRYGGVEREIERQTRAAQDPVPTLIDLVDSGRLPLNAANWDRLINNPDLIALGRSRFEDRREGIDPGAEQYGAFIPPPAPAAAPPDPTSPMAQALGYGSIKRRPMQIGRQSYSQ